MTTALLAPRDLAQCLDGYLSAVGRLGRLGVTVQFGYLAGRAATYQASTATVILRKDASIEAHLCALVDLWLYIVVGPEASGAVRRPARLRLVD